MVIRSGCLVQSSKFCLLLQLCDFLFRKMGRGPWKCPHDLVCKSVNACTSKRHRIKNKKAADAMRAVAAVSFLAVAVKVGELVAARPRDPAAVTCSAVAAAAAACAAASAHAAVTVVTPTYVTPLKRPKQTSLASFFQSPRKKLFRVLFH